MDPFYNPTVKLNSSKLFIGKSNFTPGQLLAGRYKVLRELGRGGMGVVLEVENVLIGKQFALKLLDLQEDSSAAVPRFQREAKLLSGLVHPNIVRALDIGLLDETVPYVLMELISGVTLSQHLKQAGPMSEKAVIEKFVPILEGLQYAHQNGVVHRDIKPGNIMFMESGTGVQVSKILDFGVAACTESASEALTRTGEIMGTPLYMSPEQVSGGAIKASSDIYSLGCVMFEALTGAPPFNGRTALETMMLHKSEQAPTLRSASLGNVFSERMERTISKMLAKESEDRFQTCDQVIAALTGAETARDGVRLTQQENVQGLTVEKMLGISAFLVLIVSICAFSAWVYFSGSGKDAKVAKVTEVAKVTTADPDVTAISTSPEPANGAESDDDLSLGEYMKRSAGGRHFDISQEKTDLGEFEWVDLAGIAKQAGTTKKGVIKTFTVPDECKLWFNPSRILLNKQYFLEKFAKADLEGIVLGFQNQDLLIRAGALSGCIRGMARIPALYIDRTNLPEGAIASLKSLSSIKWFAMQTVKGGLSEDQAEAISQSVNLNQLQTLNLMFELSTVHKPFLKELVKDLPRRQSHLQSLGLARCRLDEQDMRDIGKLKDLRFLNIIDCTDPHRCAPALAMESLQSCYNLNTLVLSAEYLDAAAAKKIVAMKSLRRLYFRNDQLLKPAVRDILTKRGLVLDHTDNPAFGFEPWKAKPPS
jgi:hypothetical protein